MQANLPATDVIVVGGGAAGLMAAGSAAETGARVTLLERMDRPGRKLLVTGNGRCNLTHACSARAFVEACGPGGRFLHNALARFDCAAAIAFFERRGLRVRREADGRCFPATDRSADVLGALAGLARDGGVRIEVDARVVAIRPGEGGFRVSTARGEFEARSVVLATGGRSYPATGSSGDGYALAQVLGHRVVTTRPSEVPLVAGPGWVRALAGLSLPDAGVRVTQGRKVAKLRGAVLFTHFGVSGPAVLDASRSVTHWLDQGPVNLELDLAPDDALSDVEAWLERAAAAGQKAVRTLLRERMPERLSEAVAERAGASVGAASSLPAAVRREVARCVKAVSLSVTGTRGFEEAVVTAGGIDTRDVDPRTLESRRVPGLHFAGEVLDLDGPRGGYNLQIAWSTGRAAGSHAAAAR